MSREGDNPKPHFVELGNRKKIMVLKGEQSDIEIAPPHLSRTVNSLESFADVLKHEQTSANDEGGAIVSQVFVSENGVVGIIDQFDRAERVEMKFVPSSQMLELAKLKSATNQKMFVTALRSALHGCCSYPEMVNVARKIEFKRSSDGKTTVDHGRESLGRSVEKEVRSIAGDIPEELTFRVNLLSVPSDLNTQVELKFALDINVENETLMLIPMGDTEIRERNRVVAEITERLRQLVPESALVVSGTVS